MMKLPQSVFLAAGASLLTSCVATQSSSEQAAPALGEVEALIIENGSSVDLKDIRMSVAGATRQVNVSRVLAQSAFSTAFPAREYRGNPVQLTWTQNGRMFRSQPIVFHPSAETLQDGAFTARLLIDGQGKVSALAE